MELLIMKTTVLVCAMAIVLISFAGCATRRVSEPPTEPKRIYATRVTKKNPIFTQDKDQQPLAELQRIIKELKREREKLLRTRALLRAEANALHQAQQAHGATPSPSTQSHLTTAQKNFNHSRRNEEVAHKAYKKTRTTYYTYGGTEKLPITQLPDKPGTTPEQFLSGSSQSPAITPEIGGGAGGRAKIDKKKEESGTSDRQDSNSTEETQEEAEDSQTEDSEPADGEEVFWIEAENMTINGVDLVTSDNNEVAILMADQASSASISLDLQTGLYDILINMASIDGGRKGMYFRLGGERRCPYTTASQDTPGMFSIELSRVYIDNPDNYKLVLIPRHLGIVVDKISIRKSLTEE
jgi:hypothetical protein